MPTIVDRVCIDFIIQHCCNNTKHDDVTVAWFKLPVNIIESITTSMDQLAQINLHFSKITQERERDHNMGVGSDYQEKQYETLKNLSHQHTIHNKLLLFQIYHYMIKNKLLP